MQPFAQSSPILGGAGVKVGSGVGVSGAGVELGSPAGTVSVGTGVDVIVDVEMETGVQLGKGSAVGVAGVNLGRTSVISVTTTVPHTPIKAAMMVGSILDLGELDMLVPIHKNFLYSTLYLTRAQVWFCSLILCAIWRSIFPIG